MTIFWDKIKRNIIDSFNVALDKTEELTSIGRTKLEILQIEHRLDEKYSKLGKIVMAKLQKRLDFVDIDQEIINLKDELEKLQNQLKEKEKELGRIKEEDGINFDT
jgi:chromosome segregation ATPase